MKGENIKIKVSELLKEDIDIDVYDNICEELSIAFCGSQLLIEEGKEHFKDVLTFDCEIDDDCCVIDCDGEEGVWQKKLKKAKELFNSMAGYCPCEDYDKWFVSNN